MAKIEGYASVFYDGTPDTEYQLWDGAVERIMPGAFDRALKQDDPVALFNHDPSQLLGRKSAGTLRLSVDEKGLRYEIPPADTTVFRDVLEMQARGDLKGSSFGFWVKADQRRKEDGVEIREITEVELLDVGPVTFPAYEGTNSRCYRCVTPDGRTIPLDDRQVAEVRSLFQGDDERQKREAVKKRLDKIEQDDLRFGQKT